MKISENCLIIFYDEADEKIVVRRPLEDGISKKGTVLHTEYPLTDIKAITRSRVCRLLGEDILIALAGTRTLFTNTESKKTMKRRPRKILKQKSQSRKT